MRAPPEAVTQHERQAALDAAVGGAGELLAHHRAHAAAEEAEVHDRGDARGGRGCRARRTRAPRSRRRPPRAPPGRGRAGGPRTAAGRSPGAPSTAPATASPPTAGRAAPARPPRPRTADELRAELAELLRGASDPDPSCTASRTRSCCASASATCSARPTSAHTTAGLSDLADTMLNAGGRPGPKPGGDGTKLGPRAPPAGRLRLRSVRCSAWASSAGGRSATTATSTWCSCTRPTARPTAGEPTALLHRAGPAGRSRRPAGRGRWAGCTRWTCGCGRPASRAAWCCRWPSSAGTSAAPAASCGSGRR